ncbi:hypothetical protein BDB00DRAFT_882586 [Zychaea mexicana]|uniref:uncharacterized protein n=1 Tax=Zychaea mexicana TaxID=64656 RepID=UPI0022FEE5AF|nr:uncharacterized protein BDB00DRAFT_882586 [Zychaea mexicana]KAI9495108.1 hypothetical protein BDB00DRAFT_882586 [Zychaea mexicana]
MSMAQAVLIIALQSAIASQNTSQAGVLPETASTSFGNDGIVDNIASAYDRIEHARDRLNRIKWENVAFIGFQVWFCAMVFDATVYQNAPEVIALAVLNVICSILGGLEVMDGKRWLSRIEQINSDYNLDISVSFIRIATYLEIALTVLLVLFALSFLYVSYMVVREFGWVIYKKIGPDVGVQRMYRIFQFFVLALKIDIFIEFLVSCFYFIQFAIESGFDWDTWIQLVVTVLILPMLYFGRMTVASESYGRMIVFIAFQFVVVFEFILMLRQTLEPGNLWYTWICFVVIGMVFALATAVLGAWTMHNFGKGLAPYVQRGDKKKEHPTRHELREQSSLNSWRIDDD